jgi:hypothetical protein
VDRSYLFRNFLFVLLLLLAAGLVVDVAFLMFTDRDAVFCGHRPAILLSERVQLCHAWGLWQHGSIPENFNLWGRGKLFWARFGKVLEFVGFASIIVEIIGPERLHRAGSEIREQLGLSHQVAVAVAKKAQSLGYVTWNVAWAASNLDLLGVAELIAKESRGRAALVLGTLFVSLTAACVLVSILLPLWLAVIEIVISLVTILIVSTATYFMVSGPESSRDSWRRFAMTERIRLPQGTGIAFELPGFGTALVVMSLFSLGLYLLAYASLAVGIAVSGTLVATAKLLESPHLGPGVKVLSAVVTTIGFHFDLLTS